MKQNKKKNKPSRKKNHSQSEHTEITQAESKKRGFLKTIRNIGLAVVFFGGGGWLVVDDVRATMLEQDLTRIGNGIPAIVQIHDPQCSKCVALQREARDAMSDFESDQLQFLVANIRSEPGRKLAAANGVGHVTLLLFDKNGKRRTVLTGPNQSRYLTDVFRQHVVKYGDR